MEPSSRARSKARAGHHGVVVGEKDTEWVKVGAVHIPTHNVQTSTLCAVGDGALAEAISWGTSLGGKLVGWVHTHPRHEPVLSVLDVCTLNTIGQMLWSIIPKAGPAVGVVQSWTSLANGVACTLLKGGLKAYTMSALGTEVANKCAAIHKKTAGLEHVYHEHIAGVWDDDDVRTQFGGIISNCRWSSWRWRKVVVWTWETTSGGPNGWEWEAHKGKRRAQSPTTSRRVTSA